MSKELCPICEEEDCECDVCSDCGANLLAETHLDGCLQDILDRSEKRAEELSEDQRNERDTQ